MTVRSPSSVVMPMGSHSNEPVRHRTGEPANRRAGVGTAAATGTDYDGGTGSGTSCSTCSSSSPRVTPHNDPTTAAAPTPCNTLIASPKKTHAPPATSGASPSNNGDDTDVGT